MIRFGYARVSSDDQDLTIQREALKAAGCRKIYEEKKSGTKRENRVQLQNLMDVIGEGDTLVIARIDRLARNMRDLLNILHELTEKGAALHIIDRNIDTSDALGELMLKLLAMFAEFETNIRKERQLEGIKKAKAAGVYKGRPASIDAGAVRALTADGLKPTAVAKRLGIARNSVYRILADA
jgi:DNA invertase Pin-like site-specific DNA recombinase